MQIFNSDKSWEEKVGPDFPIKALLDSGRKDGLKSSGSRNGGQATFTARESPVLTTSMFHHIRLAGF